MSSLTSSPLLAYQNLVSLSGQVVDASSESSSFPAKALSTPHLESFIWESATSALTGVDLVIDLGSASLPIDIIALLGFNGTDLSTRLAKLANNSGFSPLPFSDGPSACFNTTYTYPSRPLNDTPTYGRHVIVLTGNTLTNRYAKLTLSDSTNLDNHLKGSILWVGPAWQFPQSYDISSDPLGDYVGVPGVERRIRGWKLVVKALSEGDSVNLESIINTRLRSGRLILIPHPTKPELLHEAMYCTVVSYKRTYLPIISSTPWQVEIEFREVED